MVIYSLVFVILKSSNISNIFQYYNFKVFCTSLTCICGLSYFFFRSCVTPILINAIAFETFGEIYWIILTWTIYIFIGKGQSRFDVMFLVITCGKNM